MADAAKRITSSDIRNALKLRYEPAAHALLFEVANGTGSNGRVYADAVAFGLWPSHGHAIEGIEIKVSRGDFLRELANPGKSQPVYRYCNRWWLACPHGMVKPEEVPTTWGLLELMSNGTLRATKKAPALKPDKVDSAFVAALLRRHAGRDEEMTAAAIEAAVQKRTTSLAEEHKRALESSNSYRLGRATEIDAMLKRMREELGLDINEWSAEHYLLPALRLALKIERGTDSLREIRKAASRLAETLSTFDEEPVP